jgi:hypothetical protein
LINQEKGLKKISLKNEEYEKAFRNRSYSVFSSSKNEILEKNKSNQNKAKQKSILFENIMDEGDINISKPITIENLFSEKKKKSKKSKKFFYLFYFSFKYKTIN